MHPIIHATDMELLSDVVILDVQYELGDAGSPARLYNQGHIPGAVSVHLDNDLAGPVGDGRFGRHPLPAETELKAKVGKWGIGPDTIVVVYDRGSGAWAARAWWLLRHLGHQNVAVLQGGLANWAGATSTTPSEPEPRGDYPGEFGHMPTVEIDEVLARSREGGCIVDARAPERYRGEVEPIDPKAGHIPGAINLPFSGNLADGNFAEASALAARFQDLEDPIFYCGSGVTACHNVLAMVAGGAEVPKLFNGSWSAWSHPNANLPVET